MKMLRLLLLAIVVCGIVAIGLACGGSSDPGAGSSSNTATVSAPAANHPDPEPELRSILDKLNSGDVEGFYNELSADRRAETSAAEIEGALNNVRALVGATPKLEISEITATRLNGDNAEVDATLDVVLPSGKIPVTDTAILNWEGDSWHLADHFLDQALAVLGISGGFGASGTPVP